VAQSYLAGGHARVGIEDSVYLSRGVLAETNASMVEKARGILEDLGAQIMNPSEARAELGLSTRPQGARSVA
jgi:uncharacterized protein (DUF849 family)